MLTFQRSANLCSHLSQQIVNLRETEELLDFTLTAGGQSLKCHRLVLAANSPMLRALVTRDMKEASCLCADLDVPYNVLDKLVDYMYSGVLNIAGDMLEDALQACNYLGLEELKQQCIKEAYKELEVENIINWCRTASKLEEEPLIKACQDYLLDHLEQVLTQSEFRQLTVTEFKDLLTFGVRTDKNADDMLRALLEWTDVDSEGRYDHIQELMPLIHLDNCSNETLKDVMEKYEKLLDSNPFLYKTFLKILMSETGLAGAKPKKVHTKQAKDENKPTQQAPKETDSKLVRSASYGVVFLGGEDSFGNRNKTIFVFKDDKCIENLTLPNEIKQGCSVCCIPEGFAVTGGLRSNLCAVFNYSMNRWRCKTRMPTTRTRHKSAYVDGLLFVLGGNESGNDTHGIKYLTLKTDIWHIGPDVPEGNIRDVASVNRMLVTLHANRWFVCIYGMHISTMCWSQYDFKEKLTYIKGASMCADGNKVYLLWHSGPVFVWDTEQNNLLVKLTECEKDKTLGPVTTYDGKIIMMVENQVKEYDPKKNEWCLIKNAKIPHVLNGGYIACFKRK